MYMSLPSWPRKHYLSRLLGPYSHHIIFCDLQMGLISYVTLHCAGKVCQRQTLKHIRPGMREIEKVGNRESRESRYQKSFEKYRYQEISYRFGQNFSIQDEKV
jgi:hypothetical protein